MDLNYNGIIKNSETCKIHRLLYKIKNLLEHSTEMMDMKQETNHALELTQQVQYSIYETTVFILMLVPFYSTVFTESQFYVGKDNKP